MNPAQLEKYLKTIVDNQIQLSLMIWGAPGIGKSSVVAQTAQKHDFGFIDVRLSQLAPTDLRGLPVPDNEKAISRWYPPEFLPRDGQGILFLDELNMAPPAMQGVAQQLILDRRVGNYVVPEGWFVWAAGNRKEDRAAVFDMPAPLANRFVHLEVTADFESFKHYAIDHKLNEQIIAFLAFRPTLLHKLNPQQPAWPSPRSWEMASRLYTVGLDISSVVGPEVASEFIAYTSLYDTLPDLGAILQGTSEGAEFPTDPAARFATTIGLTTRATTADTAYNAFRWMTSNAPTEWVQLYTADMMRQLRSKSQLSDFTRYIKDDPDLQKFLQDFQKMLI